MFTIMFNVYITDLAGFDGYAKAEPLITHSSTKAEQLILIYYLFRSILEVRKFETFFFAKLFFINFVFIHIFIYYLDKFFFKIYITFLFFIYFVRLLVVAGPVTTMQWLAFLKLFGKSRAWK